MSSTELDLDGYTDHLPHRVCILSQHCLSTSLLCSMAVYCLNEGIAFAISPMNPFQGRCSMNNNVPISLVCMGGHVRQHGLGLYFHSIERGDSSRTGLNETEKPNLWVA